MVKILNYKTLQKEFTKVKETSYKRLLKIQRLERKVNKLEEELEISNRRIKEKDIILDMFYKKHYKQFARDTETYHRQEF